MVTKIGSIIVLLLMSLCVAQDIEVVMRVTDVNGNSISQATLSVPFVVEVIVSGKDLPSTTPIVEGLKRLHIENQGLMSTISSSINGVSSEKKIYRYVVRSDKETNITIGPAIVGVHTNNVRSNTVTIKITKQAVNQKSHEVRLELGVDKAEVMIGESIMLAVRFYYKPNISLLGISEPTFSQGKAQPLQGPISGSEVIDGRDVPFLEWKTHIVANKEGTLIIPALKAVYKVERHKNNSFDMFAAFFNQAFDQKTIYSNAITLSVSPLPPHQGAVHGVGLFSSIQAFIDQDNARQGEGVIVRLEVLGNGEVTPVSTPALVVPDGLNYYDSKNYTDAHNNDGSFKKVFEYVIQGTTPGSYIIPEQEFTYFDSMQKKYVTLRSNSLNLVIQEDSNNNNKSLVITTSAHDDNVVKSDIVEYDALPLHYGPWKETINRSMSLSSFLLLTLAPFLIALLYIIIMFITSRPFMVKRRIFKMARHDIHNVSSVSINRNFYDIFVTLFAHVYAVPPTHISLEFINERLKEHGCSDDFLREWNSFFTTLMAYRFSAQQQKMKEDYRVLQQQSFAWLKRLEKVV